ncbi:MAG: glycosyl transferase family 1, partial [Bacteroidia bacterium]
MPKKKILIVGPSYPLRGGLATYNERLCRAFIEQGHDCEILSFSLQYPSLLFPGKTQFSADPNPNDIRIYSEINSINPLNWIRVGKKFARNKYDLVIFRYWMSFMAPSFGTIARLLQKSGARVIAITDNIVPHEKRFFDSAFTSYFLH